MVLSAAELGSLPKDEFVSLVGTVYEHSPMFAERAHAFGPFENLTSIHAAMVKAVAEASDEEKLALLCAHPDLAGRAAVADELSADSTVEQKKSGLLDLTTEERARMLEMNSTYRSKFGFPFILAVRNATKHTILGSIAARISNQQSQERDECLKQVNKIAWMRLRELATPAPTGFLTCHVLDTARGCPAAGMRIELHRIDGDKRDLLGSYVTNSDGRTGPVLKGEAFKAGVYEWSFYAGDYFIAAGVPVSGQPFLDMIPLRFGIDNPEDHYHVPLLASPWSMSTYRGS
jgi:2-oxo-4-hydroxy-4-carboxy-5-ureidoimidazoline decarboxylase